MKATLTAKVTRIDAKSRKTYNSPKITKILHRKGEKHLKKLCLQRPFY